jgi:hypothetical protein
VTIVVAEGLHGENPLHVLAALGALRLAERLDSNARLGWVRVRGGWRAALSVNVEPEALFVHLAATLVASGREATPDPAAQRMAKDLAAREKKLRDQKKGVEKRLKAECKAMGLRGTEQRVLVSEHTAAIDKELREVGEALRGARIGVALGLGDGPAHLGDVIGVSAEIFAASAERAVEGWLAGRRGDPDPTLWSDQLPGLCSDAVVADEKLVPTPFSFSNGGSGQALLKDFRKLAREVTVGHVRALFTGGGERWIPHGTSLNWDPADQRSYALGWSAPESMDKPVDVPSNALAFFGLGVVTGVPTARGIRAIASPDQREGGGLVWPLWAMPLSLEVVRSLFASHELRMPKGDLSPLFARGVVELRWSAVSNPTGKRNFFAPSRPL